MRDFLQSSLSVPVLFVLNLVVIAIVIAIPCIFGPRLWCRFLAGAALILSAIGASLALHQPRPPTTNEFEAAFGSILQAVVMTLLLVPEMFALLLLTLGAKYGRGT